MKKQKRKKIAIHGEAEHKDVNMQNEKDRRRVGLSKERRRE